MLPSFEKVILTVLTDIKNETLFLFMYIFQYKEEKIKVNYETLICI